MGNKVSVLILLLLITFFPVGMASPTAINLNFVDADVGVILHTLATINGVDMVIDDSIKGNLTMKLDNVSFDTALMLITEGKGLSYRRIDNAIIIEPADMGITEINKLQYTRAVDIKRTLEPIAGNLKLKIEIDDVSNSLIVSGSPAACNRIKALLKVLDVLQQQVSIEAKVVAINKSSTKDLGIGWSWDVTPQYPTVTTNIAVVDGTTGIITKPETTTVTRTSNKGVIQFGHNPENIPYEFYYQAKINALASKGDAKILASPKITTINGKEAHVLIGDRIPVLTDKTSNGVTTSTAEYIDVGIKLTYTPSITANGTITAKVRTEVSTPILVSDIKNYRITTREAESTVCMKDGETMVIAGLIGNENSKTTTNVPFLSEIPILGALFKNQSNSKSETEVVIFLTATIVK